MRGLFRITFCTLIGVILTACTQPAMSARHVGATALHSPQADVSTVRAATTWPKHARIVAIVRAPKPPADDVARYKAILLAAYQKVCPDVTTVDSRFVDFRQRSLVIQVRCEGGRVKAVRLDFTGVVVPNLGFLSHEHGMNEPQTLLSMLGLGLRAEFRPATAGAAHGDPISQHPSPGEVVPFGTVITYVVAR